MKKIYTIFTISLLLLSCGKKSEVSTDTLVAKGNLKELRERKSAITANLDALNTDLKAINNAIAKLDTVKKLPLITTLTTKEAVFEHYLELQGNVKTKQNVLIYPEMPGILTNVNVKEGQRVSKGELLATIDDGGLSQQITQLEIQEQLAKTTYERQERLWKQKIGSEIQFLQAKATYEGQVNTVKQLKRQQAKSLIKAPFSGIIDDVMKEAGSVVAPGQGAEIFRIVNLNNMYIQAEVPENYIKNITAGKKVEIYFPVLAKEVTEKIRQVSNFINPANRTFNIEVGVGNKDKSIKPNLTAKLKINDYTNTKALLIPQSIVSENSEGEQYVYVVADFKDGVGTAKQAIVTTGKTQAEVVEVLNGIKTGDQIIMEGARSVQNGQQVQVLN